MATIDTIADRSNGSEVAGKMYFETSTNKLIAYNGSTWIELDSDGTGAVPFENRWGASFDGSSDYLDIGTVSALNSTTSFTISMWINFENVTGSVVMSPFTSGTSTNNRVEFVFNNINELRFGVNGSVNNCTFDISSYRSTNAWHNIVGTFDGSNVTLFFDGSQVSTTTSSVPSSTSSTHGNDTTVGRRTLGGGSLYFNGLIDDVAIFSSALDQSAVTDLYSGGTPDIITGASGYWRMGDDSNDSATSGGSIATITDSSGNGNDATQGTASAQPTFSELEQATTSLSFDGSNDYLDLSALDSTISSIGTGAVTISMWVKFDTSIPAYSGILHFGNADAFSDYFYCRYNNGSIEFQAREGASGVSNVLASVSTNVWYHLVFIRSGTTGTIYVNNSSTSVTNAEFGVDFSNNTNNFMRVGSNRTNTQAGKVLVDEVAVFNSALSASDVTSVYNNGTPADISSLNLNPLGWWKMGEDDNLTHGASASQISDISGNNNHATQSTAANQPTATIPSTIYV